MDGVEDSWTCLPVEVGSNVVTWSCVCGRLRARLRDGVSSYVTTCPCPCGLSRARLPCCHVALCPWTLGSASLPRQALVPPRGSMILATIVARPPAWWASVLTCGTTPVQYLGPASPPRQALVLKCGLRTTNCQS
jgi:hypothetical protein